MANRGERGPSSVASTRIDVAGAVATPTKFSSTIPKGTAVESLVPGQRVRQYEVIRELGRGGMGHVMLARDTRLGRRVAMKFLATTSREHTLRFLAEARTTAALNHENIVVIHEVDEVNGVPYMVLEYLEGSPLRKLLDGTGMPAARAIDIALPIVRALVRAHEAGIVHRDLKPENVFVTDAGNIKVLDFGIAKLLSHDDRPARAVAVEVAPHDLGLTSVGTLVGTLPYMSPEQAGVDDIDHRSDLWAVGIMLFEMVTGRHPLDVGSATALLAQLADFDEPMPAVGTDTPDLPERFERVVDRCLAKRKQERYASARELLDDLEQLVPGRHRRSLDDHDSPYPGLTTFQEADADRFFGRDQDVLRTVTRVREQPLVAIVGPSGVGKSSFVRAGIVPALKASGEAWQVHVLRPGRHPLAGLAGIIDATTSTSRSAAERGQHDAITDRLVGEPGYFGDVLRAYAARKQTQVLVFVDQFEELYTQVTDSAERLAYTACLAAAADEVASPIRIVVSMRSDLLDRAGEDRRFLDEMTRGLVFLQPLGPAALREALVQPIEARGYRFETREMVDEMLATLATTPGALPLLQFAASTLWETRDRGRKLLTRASYDVMGGISGALATHADQVLATLAPEARQHARAVLQRLVTPERTRAVVDMRDLHELSTDPRAIETVIDHLVAARLLVVQSSGDATGSVEIVHESLTTSWPTLRRWLDEGQEDAAQLAQLRAAAAQWDSKGRIQGLLWRGEALDDARRWRARYRGELPARERSFLAAVFALGTRATRVKRAIVVGVITLLSLAVAVGAVALISIGAAEQTARLAASHATDEQKNAEEQRAHAQAEAQRAKLAEKVAQERLDQIKAEQLATQKAENEATTTGIHLKNKETELAAALAKAEHERALALEQAKNAHAAALAEKQAKDEFNRLYLVEKSRREAAEKQRSKITTELPK